MTPGLLLYTSLDQQYYLSLMRTDFFYYLVGPGQPTMQYYSSLEGVSVFDQNRPFFNYLVGPTSFSPPLNMVISPYKFSFHLTASRNKSIQAYSRHCTPGVFNYIKLRAKSIEIGNGGGPKTRDLVKQHNSLLNYKANIFSVDIEQKHLIKADN